jgi:hypothetical protein
VPRSNRPTQNRPRSENLFEAQRIALLSRRRNAERQLKSSAEVPGVTPAELAAWQAIATALLNLDEMITKG